MPARKTRIAVSALALAAGVLLSTSLGNNETAANSSSGPGAIPAPTFSIALGRGELRLRGVTASAGHEAALLQLAEDHFDDVDAFSDFASTVLLPGFWDAATNRLTYAIAAAESASAVIEPHAVHIRAVSTEPDTLTARIAFLDESLSDDVKLTTDIVDVRSAASHADLCRRAFAAVALGPISFRESSAELRDSTFATLDRLVELVHDCPGATLEIIGHTDASGHESWNLKLSTLRAQAVADELIANGVSSGRITTRGEGEARPVAGNDTQAGRQLNRRVELVIQPDQGLQKEAAEAAAEG